jgi:hypothetical protein
MIEIIKLIVIFFILVDLTSFISEVISTLGTPKNKLLGVSYLLITYLLSCSRCTTFWGSLIITGDLFTSAVVAIIVNFLKEIEYKYKNKTTL